MIKCVLVARIQFSKYCLFFTHSNIKNERKLNSRNLSPIYGLSQKYATKNVLGGVIGL